MPMIVREADPNLEDEDGEINSKKVTWKQGTSNPNSHRE